MFDYEKSMTHHLNLPGNNHSNRNRTMTIYEREYSQMKDFSGFDLEFRYVLPEASEWCLDVEYGDEYVAYNRFLETGGHVLSILLLIRIWKLVVEYVIVTSRGLAMYSCFRIAFGFSPAYFS